MKTNRTRSTMVVSKISASAVAGFALCAALATAGLGMGALGSSALAAEGEGTAPASTETAAPASETAGTAATETTTTETTTTENATGTEDAATLTSVTVTLNDNAKEASNLYDLVNSYRTEQGLTELSRNSSLENSAWQRAAETTVLPSEVRPDGSAFLQTSDGVVLSGQVLIEDAASAADALEAWKASDAYASLLASDTAQSFGIACVTDSEGTCHWVILISDEPAAQEAASDSQPSDSSQHVYTLSMPANNVVEATGDTTESINVSVGSSQQLSFAAYATGSVVAADGATYDFSTTQLLGITDGAATWRSSDPTIASVDASGLLTANAQGTTTVVATVTSDAGTSATTVWNVSVAAQAAPATTTEAASANIAADAVDETQTNTTEEQQNSATQESEPIDLANCTVVGVTGFTFDESGNPVLPPLSVTAPDGSSTIDPSQYTASISYDEASGEGTITIVANPDSTTVTGTLTYTVYPETTATATATETDATQTTETDVTQTTDTTQATATDATQTTDATQATATDATQTDATAAQDSQADLGTSEPTAEQTGTQESAATDSASQASSSQDQDQSGSAASEDATTPIDISSMSVTVEGVHEQSYTGSAIEPKPVISINGQTLVEGTDYTLSYSDNVNPGLATITITGIGNYTGTRTATFSIKDDGKTDLATAGFAIDEIGDQTFTGSAIRPTVRVTDGSTVLEENKDYTVSYANNINVGTATVTVTATDSSSYTGSITATFNIVPLDLSYVTIVMPNQTYTGSALTPVPESVTTSSGYVLTLGVDYEVTGYTNNVNTGTGYATITGIGNFTGAQNAAFKISEGQSSGSTTTLPKTGDTTNTVPVIAGTIAGVALIALGTGIVIKRRRSSSK